jgi:hypothetical protein
VGVTQGVPAERPRQAVSECRAPGTHEQTFNGYREANVYIGIGTLVLVLLIILIVWALRGRTV